MSSWCCPWGAIQSSDTPILDARLTMLLFANQSSAADSTKTSIVGNSVLFSRSEDFGAALRSDGSDVKAEGKDWALGVARSAYACWLCDIVGEEKSAADMVTNESTLSRDRSFVGGSSCRLFGFVFDALIGGSKTSSGVE